MGAWDRFRHVVSQGVQDLLNAPEPEALLKQAVDEMERELLGAVAQEEGAHQAASHARELHTMRSEEAQRFGVRAQTAEDDHLPDEAARLRTAQHKALQNAQALEGDAVRAEQHAAQVRDAVAGLRQLIEDARTKQDQVRQRMEQIRKVRAQAGPAPQVGESPPPPPPPPRGSGPFGERTFEDTTRDLDALTRKASVEDALSQLKKKMSGG